mgnify:CR=1 FL=1
MKRIRVASFFSGAGGLDLGLCPSLFEIVCFSEIDKWAAGVFQYHHKGVPNLGDITKIRPQDVPSHNFFVFGSPCQDLSVSGSRKGIHEGERSGLFHMGVQIIKEKRPSHILWENVEGALSSQKGWDFATVQTELAEIGYDLRWEVLNGKEFGVPQNRTRVFLFGTLREEGSREILLRRSNQPQLNLPFQTSQPEEERCIRKHHLKQNGRILTRFSHTITKVEQPHAVIGERVRRLTPRECERLMSWPDDFTRWGIIDGEVQEMSDRQRYNMIGNGVISNCVRQIVSTLLS